MQPFGRSTLIGHRYQLVGFGYDRHPLGKSKRMQFTLYRQEGNAGKYLICISDVTVPQMKEFTPIIKKKLGKFVDAEEVIPYVQRGFENATYATVKQAIRDGLGLKVKWWKGDPDAVTEESA